MSLVTDEDTPQREIIRDNRLLSRVRDVFGRLTRAQKQLIAMILTIGAVASAVTAVLDLSVRLTASNPDDISELTGKMPFDNECRPLLDEDAVCVVGVVSGSPADRAGVKVGDIITDVGGSSVEDVDDFERILKQHRTGDTVLLSIVEDDSHTRYVRVKLEHIEGSKLRLGVQVEDVEPQRGAGSPPH
jgi:hypothetical protein